MTNSRFTAAFAACLAICSLPLACGDDEEGGGGKGGTSGSAGNGGSGGKGGTSGTSGASGKGGTSGEGGTSGKGGTSGTSGTSGTAGTTPGGAGGADDGGMGGEGGGGTTTTQCEAICAKATHCTDLSTCEADLCTSYSGCEPFDQAVRDCLENETTSLNFFCSDDKPIYNYDAGGPCDDELDAWFAQGC